MFFWHIVPSWHQIEDRIRQEMGYQGGAQFRNHWGEPAPSLSLNIRRVESVRTAFYQAEWQAGDLLRRRFADLDISFILNDLIDVVTQMAMIVAGSTLTGGAIGAGVGAFFGGAGAIPMGTAGAALGMQVSSWILTILGLQSVAEFFVEGLPRVGGYYLTGIQAAWEGPRGEEGLTPFSQDDPFAVSSAAHNIALGHVEVVVLLLGAIVEYLTRARGNAGRLAQEMGASPKGANIGQWMLKHEDALKSRPDLQKAEPLKGGMGPQHQLELPQTRPVQKTASEIEEKAGSIKKVNPGYPEPGRTHNCVNCSIATDATLSGAPASALPIKSTKGVPISVLERQFGGKFGLATTPEKISQQMVEAGDGARGIVFGSYGPGQPGHVFNVVNQRGAVRYLDGQTGKSANLLNFDTLQLLRTN
ncbi:toxin glutamine deamidase domain-containing protein [Pseudomonas sp. W2Oct36]|uniref:DUF6861 domain-containing protein n=1 Tax=Pseudomonas sp. W2Oct36 TaxID=1215284 RepID=UPI0034E0C117